MTWYLVMANLYLGPLSETQCQMSATYLREAGVMCKQADYMYACAVDGRPGTFTACPHFTYPEITIK